jgi:hypothetical protein
VTDTHPEYEVGDIERPADRFIQTPGPDPHQHGVGGSVDPDSQYDGRKRETDPPSFGSFIFKWTANIPGYVRIGFTTQY